MQGKWLDKRSCFQAAEVKLWVLRKSKHSTKTRRKAPKSSLTEDQNGNSLLSSPSSHQAGVSPGKGVALLRCAVVLWFIPSFLFSCFRACSAHQRSTWLSWLPFSSLHTWLSSSPQLCVYKSVSLLFPAFQVLYNGLLEMTSGFTELKVKECSGAHCVQFVWFA